MSSREEARKDRAQSRARRRKEPDAPESEASEAEPDEGDHLEGVKQAAKVAAVGAAVGAATAAARALTHQDRGGSEEDASEPIDAPRVEEETVPSEAEGEQDESTGAGHEGEKAVQTQREAQPQDRRASQTSSERPDNERPPGAGPEEASTAVRTAREQLQALLGRDAETVSAFERTHDGWLITLEVVELARIPDSTDLLASYEVELDENCGLRRYARVGRYARAHANSGEQR